MSSKKGGDTEVSRKGEKMQKHLQQVSTMGANPGYICAPFHRCFVHATIFAEKTAEGTIV